MKDGFSNFHLLSSLGGLLGDMVPSDWGHIPIDAVRDWSRASESDLCVSDLGSAPGGEQLRVV